jgi:hypothetical protein
MRDPGLWTSWYVALLLFPFMIFVMLVRDFLSRRTAVAVRRNRQKRGTSPAVRPRAASHL